MKLRKLTKEISQLRFEADIRLQSLNEANRTVEFVFSVGARGLRQEYFWEDPYFEELEVSEKAIRMGRIKNGAPFMLAHRQWDIDAVVGVIEDAWIEGEALVGRVRFSEHADDDKYFQKVKSGILRKVSVGYRVYTYMEVESGEEKYSVFRAVDWEPVEVSLVPIGFDDSAQSRKLQERAADEKYDCEFQLKVRGKVMKKKTPAPGSEAQNDEIEVTEEQVRTEARAEGVEAGKAAGVAEEKTRVLEIRKAVKKAGLGEDVADKLIEEDVPLDKARAQIIDAIAEKSEKTETRSPHAIQVGTDGKQRFQRDASDWLIARAGHSGLVEKQEGRKLEIGETRGMSLFDLARACLEISGVRVRGLGRMELVGQAFTHRSGPYQSTSDFAIMLENALHKILQASYAIQPDTWRRFCGVGTLSDFRAHGVYRMGSFGRLDTLQENGEFKRKVIPDAEKESLQADTVGNIIGLTRKAIVNDDMMAFNQLASMLGRAAQLSVEIDVYALFALNSGAGPTMADGNPFFHSSHNNLIASGGAAPTVTSVDATRVLLENQKDPSSNNYLGLKAHAWVGPTSLGGAARVVNDSQYDPDANSKLQRANSVRGIFKDVVDTPRLSGAPWYMFADPTLAPAFMVGFVDGQQSPVLELMNSWNVDGVEWKVRHDYGVGAVDFRAAAKNPGQ